MITKLSEDELKANLPSNATSETNDVKDLPSKLNDKSDNCTILKNAEIVLNGLENSYKEAKLKVKDDYAKNQCQNSSIDENKK
jgi:hypothetical protein